MSKLTGSVSHYQKTFFSKLGGQKRFRFDLNHKFTVKPKVINGGPKFQPQHFWAFLTLQLRLIRTKKS